MAKLVVEKMSGLSPQEAFKKVRNVLSDDKDLKKLDPGYKCTFEDATLKGSASGKLFKANMEVAGHEGGCRIQIVVDLPLALMLAKGMIEKTLKRKLEESLA